MNQILKDQEIVRKVETSLPKLSDVDLKKITRSHHLEGTAVAGLTCTGC